MPTKPITKQTAASFARDVCKHPDHNPSQHVVLPPGLYEHECEGCHRKMVFVVDERNRLG